MKTILRIATALSILAGLFFVFTSCAAPPASPGSGAPAAPSPAKPPVSADPAIVAAWQGSKHANSYVTTGDNNNECARCHSPRNWTPTDSADMPKTCASCKFTVKPPKPVSKTDWKAIGCDSCHQVEKGTVPRQVMWLNALVAEFETNANPYETVSSNTELCEKCHRDVKTFTYKRDMGRSTHTTQQCTNCHDPHSLKADCAACHGTALKSKTITGHDAAHSKVHCVACHDASGLKAGPVDGQNIWMPFRTLEVQGKKTTVPYQSHNLQKKVDCARCHYAGNPWNLKVQA